MSFFIKSKSTANGVKRAKYAKNDKSKRKKPKNIPKDEEITSSEDEISENKLSGEELTSEDENETAQEKKLRLAKVYLEEIERQEKRRLEDKELDQSVIAKRLKDDYLKQIGKFRSKEADKYKGVDIENLSVLKCREHNNAITCLCISSDDKYLYSGSKDGSIVKWSLDDNKKIGKIPFIKDNGDTFRGHSNKIMCITISTDNKFLVVADDSADVQVWNPDNLKHIHTLKGHRNTVTGVCFKKDTHTLYTCSKDKSVKVWSLDEMAYVETLYGHQDMITSLDALYRDRVVTAGGRDTTVRIWKIPEESQLIFNGPAGSIDVVRLISEENFVTGGDDGNLCVWSSLKKKPICCVEKAHGCDPTSGEAYWITSIAALVNTDLIASGSNSGSVKIWKLGEGFKTLSLLFEVPIIGFVNAMLFTSDGNKLIVATGREHRFGRWSVVKSAKNSIFVIQLIKS